MNDKNEQGSILDNTVPQPPVPQGPPDLDNIVPQPPVPQGPLDNVFTDEESENSPDYPGKMLNQLLENIDPGENTENDNGEENDSESVLAKKEQKRKEEIKKIKKKNKEDVQKPLINKIRSTFWNPASQIPADLQQSLKETGKSIKKATEKTIKNPKIKPEEKTSATKEIATDVGMTGVKQSAFETVLKLIREALKEAIKAASPYSWIAVAAVIAIIILGIIFLCILVLVSGATAGLGASTEAENMNENLSITSEYFYGVRAAYINEDALISALQQSYKQYASDVIVEIEESGVDITIDIITIDDETKLPKPVNDSSNTHYNALSLSIGNSVAGKSESSFSAELYNAIPYFGLTDSQQSDVNSIIVNYIKDNSLYSGSFPDDIESQLNANTYLNYVENRCEKVMIKDYIAEESGLQGVEQLLYIGSIYMPRLDMTISALSTAITTTTPEIPVEVSCISRNGEKTTTLASGTTNSDEGKVIIDSVDGSNLELLTFSGIDKGNIEAFKGGISLFEAIRLGAMDGKDYSIFFEKTPAVLGIEIYTWKPSATSVLYLTYSSTSKFIFSDLEFQTAKEER